MLSVRMKSNVIWSAVKQVCEYDLFVSHMMGNILNADDEICEAKGRLW